VIESHHSVTPLLTGLPPPRKPAPVEQPAAVRDHPSRVGPGPFAPRGTDLEALSAQLAGGRGGGGHDTRGLGLRAAQAVNAYSATQSHAERDYVAQVFGLDTWV
jgi:hypothetical protein